MNQVAGFNVTFEVVTDESAMHGDAERRGWIVGGNMEVDDAPEDPAYQFDSDDYDPEEHASLSEARVEWAVGTLSAAGANHFSGNELSPWWSTESQIEDYTTDERYTYSYHPVGFSDDEVSEIIRRTKN